MGFFLLPFVLVDIRFSLLMHVFVSLLMITYYCINLMGSIFTYISPNNLWSPFRISIRLLDQILYFALVEGRQYGLNKPVTESKIWINIIMDCYGLIFISVFKWKLFGRKVKLRETAQQRKMMSAFSKWRGMMTLLFVYSVSYLDNQKLVNRITYG